MRFTGSPAASGRPKLFHDGAAKTPDKNRLLPRLPALQSNARLSPSLSRSVSAKVAEKGHRRAGRGRIRRWSWLSGPRPNLNLIRAHLSARSTFCSV